MRIGVAGVAGRVGRLVAEAIGGQAVLVGGLARDTQTAPPGIRLFGSIQALAAACDAVIDFTHADTAEHHAGAVAAAGTAWVLGTTGLSAPGQSAVRQAAGRVPVVQAANFSAGVTLLLAVAERLASALPGADYDAEVLEMHHRAKQDAPSGTALALAEAVARGRSMAGQAAIVRARDGQTGPRQPGSIGLAALRGGSVVGAHTLLFAGDCEHISVAHTALDRGVFARGAVRAALWTHARPPGLYGMADVLGLTDLQPKEAPER